MKPIQRGGRSTKIAVAFGALLVTASCAGIDTRYPQESGLPPHLDGGIGQLLRYCGKFYDSGDLVTAAAMCERAHNLEPKNPEPLLQLADVLNAMGQPQQAVTAYRRVLDVDPGHVEARYRLGRQYISMKQYDLAANEFRAALREAPNDPRLYNALGVSEGLFGDHQAAQAAFRQGLEVDSSHVSLRNNLALSLVLNGNADEGIAMLEDIAAGSTANETTQENLQLAYGIRAAAQSDAALADALPADAPQPETDGSQQAAMAAPRESEASLESEDVMDMAYDGSDPSKSGSDQDGAPIALDMAMRPDQPATEDPTPANSPAEMHNSGSRWPGAFQTARAATPDSPEAYEPDAELGGYLGSTMSSGTEDSASTEQTDGGHDMPSLASSYESGEYEVQLASYRSEADAMSGWSKLSARAGSTLGGMEPVVRRADLGPDKGIYYRLRTQGFAKADAQSLCQSLKARDIDCLVVREVAAAPVESAAKNGSDSTL